MKTLFAFTLFALITSGCVHHEIYTVTLEVNCDLCDVAFGNDAGERTLVEDVRGQWMQSYPIVSGSLVYLAASDTGPGPTHGPETISIRISSSGSVLAEEKETAYLPRVSMYYNVP